MSPPSFPTINQSHIQAALAEAAVQEQGTMLNDHYSPDFYVERRAGVLGSHPDYKQRSGLKLIATDDSYIIFGHADEDLSVQEVRRREIIHEIVPFTPFPTTGNCETIDDYGGLPDSEWEEGKEGVYPESSPTPSPAPRSLSPVDSASEGRVQQTKPASIRANSAEIELSSEQTQTPASPQQMDATVPIAPANAGPSPSLEPGDAAQQSAPATGMEFLPGILDQLNRLHPQPAAVGSSAAPTVKANTPPTANAETVSPAAGPSTAASQHATNPVKRSRTSAFPHRATTTLVKVRKGSKRALSGRDDLYEVVSADSAGEDSQDDTGDDASPPPAKKKLKTNPAKPAAARKPAPKTAATATSSAGKKPAARKPSAPARTTLPTPATDPLDAIIHGTALPRSRAQAVDADDQRYALLLLQHNRALRARGEEAEDEPDLMPEYFHTANFPADAAKDQVRCVCGVVTDDNEEMVCCDGCDVWQHTGCMRFQGGIGKKGKGKGYRCQNCDPWVHRRVIMEMRRGNVVR